MADFSVYQPPGVYIDETQTPLVATIGTTPTVIAICGPSVGYQTYTEAVTLIGTTAVTLSKLGINDASVVVQSKDGVLFTLTTDYVLTEAAGDDTDLGTEADNTYTIKRAASGSAIDSGDTVIVSYQYTDTTYFAPQKFTDFDSVKAVFGEPINLSTSAITSPLSLAAKLAFENGASEIVLVATTGSATATTRSELSAAYTKLTGLSEVNVIVALPVGIAGTDGSPGDTANVGADLKAHCDSLATQGIFRIGIIGLDMANSGRVTPSSTVAFYASARVMHVWPYKMSFYNGTTNQTISVSGYYLAAAIAGILAALEARVPVTKKKVRGFQAIPGDVLNSMSLSVRNAYSDAGVCVIERSRSGNLVVRHGTSTDRTNIYTREVSLTRAKDALINLINDSFDATEIIGSPIDLETSARLKSLITGVLEAAKTLNIIVDYNGVGVRQRPADPTIMEVKFQYKPAYPLNYVVITFSINITTGETDLLPEA